jgi:hypothetical protein
MALRGELNWSGTYLDIHNDLRVELALLRNAHCRRESGGWLPLGGLARADLLKHAVDLLEGEAIGLGYEEVGVDEADGAEGAPDEEDLGAEVALVFADHVGGDDGDDAVPEPVGGRGEGDAAGADGEGEDLADDDPGGWTLYVFVSTCV